MVFFNTNTETNLTITLSLIIITMYNHPNIGRNPEILNMNVTEFIITSARSNNTKPKSKSFAQKMLYSPDTEKWIQENKIPKTLEQKIINLCSFEGHDPQLILITHSTSNARRWKEVIKALINHTISNNESGHDITTYFETINENLYEGFILPNGLIGE